MLSRKTGRFEAEEDAHGTITATLETMSGCIARGQAEDIADESNTFFYGETNLDGRSGALK